MINESDGFAYLRQLTEEEASPGYQSLPKLFRSQRLSYSQTLLCVLLREELRRFEEEDTRNDRCVVEQSVLFEQWKLFFTAGSDEPKLLRDLLAALRKLDDIGLVRQFNEDPAAWEVRRLLKTRLPASELERLRAQFVAYRAFPSGTNPETL